AGAQAGWCGADAGDALEAGLKVGLISAVQGFVIGRAAAVLRTRQVELAEQVTERFARDAGKPAGSIQRTPGETFYVNEPTKVDRSISQRPNAVVAAKTEEMRLLDQKIVSLWARDDRASRVAAEAYRNGDVEIGYFRGGSGRYETTRGFNAQSNSAARRR